MTEDNGGSPDARPPLQIRNQVGATSMFLLPFWQRLIITIIAMLAASYLISLAWQQLFDFPLPIYLGGVIGGLAALPVWDFLKRIRPRGS